MLFIVPLIFWIISLSISSIVVAHYFVVLRIRLIISNFAVDK